MYQKPWWLSDAPSHFVLLAENKTVIVIVIIFADPAEEWRETAIDNNNNNSFKFRSITLAEKK